MNQAIQRTIEIDARMRSDEIEDGARRGVRALDDMGDSASRAGDEFEEIGQKASSGLSIAEDALRNVQRMLLGYLTIQGAMKLGEWAYDMVQARDTSAALATVMRDQLAPAGLSVAAAMETVRAATRGAINDLELMTQMSRMLDILPRMGVDTATALQLFETTAEYSVLQQALGRGDASDIMSQMVAGWTTPGVMRLQNYGLVLDDIRPRIETARDGMDQMNLALGEQGHVVEETITRWVRLKNAWDNMWLKGPPPTEYIDAIPDPPVAPTHVVDPDARWKIPDETYEPPELTVGEFFSPIVALTNFFKFLGEGGLTTLGAITAEDYAGAPRAPFEQARDREDDWQDARSRVMEDGFRTQPGDTWSDYATRMGFPVGLSEEQTADMMGIRAAQMRPQWAAADRYQEDMVSAETEYHERIAAAQEAAAARQAVEDERVRILEELKAIRAHGAPMLAGLKRDVVDADLELDHDLMTPRDRAFWQEQTGQRYYRPEYDDRRTGMERFLGKWDTEYRRTGHVDHRGQYTYEENRGFGGGIERGFTQFMPQGGMTEMFGQQLGYTAFGTMIGGPMGMLTAGIAEFISQPIKEGLSAALDFLPGVGDTMSDAARIMLEAAKIAAAYDYEAVRAQILGGDPEEVAGYRFLATAERLRAEDMPGRGNRTGRLHDDIMELVGEGRSVEAVDLVREHLTEGTLFSSGQIESGFAANWLNAFLQLIQAVEGNTAELKRQNELFARAVGEAGLRAEYGLLFAAAGSEEEIRQYEQMAMRDIGYLRAGQEGSFGEWGDEALRDRETERWEQNQELEEERIGIIAENTGAIQLLTDTLREVPDWLRGHRVETEQGALRNPLVIGISIRDADGNVTRDNFATTLADMMQSGEVEVEFGQRGGILGTWGPGGWQ